MDFLNKAFAQLSQLFRSLTPGARIASGLLLAVLAVSVAYLFYGGVGSPDTYLLGGHPFPPGRMPAVEGALASKGLDGYVVEGNLIRIPRSQQAEYVAALADADLLPADSSDYLMKVIQDASPFASGSQRQELLEIAREEFLSMTIRKMSGIESATVMIDKERRSGFRREEIVTAAVQVKPVGTSSLDDELVHSIRSYVASSVAGLAPNKVTVVDANSGQAWTSTGGDGVGGAMDNDYFSLMRAYESHYENDVRKLLSYVPGATVSVNVELNTERKTTTQNVEIDPKTITVSRREESTSATSETAAPAGRPGFAAQQRANQSAQLRASNNQSQTQEESLASEEANTASHSTAMTENVGLTPKKVTVAIGIPSSYFTKIWYERHPASEGEQPQAPTPTDLAEIEQQESAKIREAVFQRIPHTENAASNSLVTVAAFTPLPSPQMPEPGVSEQALAWVGTHWTTIGLLVLVGFSLLMLRAMIRSVPAAPPAMPPAMMPPSSQPTDSTPSTASAETNEARLKRRGKSGPSLRDDLVDLVREDPDSAANVLRGWIANTN